MILETCLLTDEEIVEASKVAKAAGADFVKTSTGFSTGGATVKEWSKLMREAVGPELGVKASGGVRDAAFAKRSDRSRSYPSWRKCRRCNLRGLGRIIKEQ